MSKYVYEGQVKVTVDAKALSRDVEKAAEQAGKKGGQELGDGLTKGADGKLRDSKGRFVKAGADIGKETGKKAGQEMGDGLVRGADGKLRDSKGRFVGAGKKIGEDAGEAAGKSFADRMGRHAERLNSVGNKLTVGLTLPMAMAAKSGIEMAASLEDARGATEILYESGAGVIDEFIGSQGDFLNMTERQIRENLNLLHPFMAGFGDASEQAEAATTAITRMVDAGAMYGVKVDEAVGALTSALRGEYNPIERLGVNLRASDVALRAKEMGLLAVNTTDLAIAQVRVEKAEAKVEKLRREGKQGTLDYAEATAQLAKAQEDLDDKSQGAMDSLTAESKAVATMALVYEQTAKAEGQLGRESEGTAYKLADATQKWEEFQVLLGEKVIPVVIPLLEKLVAVVDVFGRMPGPMQTAGLAILGLSGPILKIVAAFSRMRSAAIAAQAAAAAAQVTGAGGGAGLLGAGGKAAGKGRLAAGAGTIARTAGPLAAAAAVGTGAGIGIQKVAGETFAGIGETIGDSRFGKWIGDGGGVGDWLDRNLNFMATGGVVKSSPGGTPAVIGEGGRDEAVVPLSGDPRIVDAGDELDALLSATNRTNQLLERLVSQSGRVGTVGGGTATRADAMASRRR